MKKDKYYINTSKENGGRILGHAYLNTGFNHEVTNIQYVESQHFKKINTIIILENGKIDFSFVDYKDETILTEKEIRNFVQSHLDKEAKKWGYDNIYTAIGYRGDPNPEFNQEAEMFFKWRSAVWTYTNIEMDKVKAGNRDMPTREEDITSELPKAEDYE